MGSPAFKEQGSAGMNTLNITVENLAAPYTLVGKPIHSSTRLYATDLRSLRVVLVDALPTQPRSLFSCVPELVLARIALLYQELSIGVLKRMCRGV